MPLFNGVVGTSKLRFAGDTENLPWKKKLAKCSNPKPIVSNFFVSVLIEHLFINPTNQTLRLGTGKSLTFYSVYTLQDGF